MSAENADNEKIDTPSYQALEEAHKLMKEAYEIMKHEAMIVRKEKEAFDSVAKKLEHVHFSSTVKLNVGGQLFSTSLQTLTKDPGSMLHAMFSGRFDTKPSEDGSYFIDRDGTHFRFILNYLRTGKILIPEEKLVQREVLEEAEFYQIRGIIDELNPTLFEESEILSAKHNEIFVNSWLKGQLKTYGSRFVLLYRASRDGWAASNFHACCDNKGPTVTVVKSGESIFGGFTEQSWDSSTSGIYRKASKSFLFSLVNPTGLPATKMDLLPGREDFAVYCDKNLGPTFGGGIDLCIANSPNSYNCHTNLNNSYQLPKGQNAATFFTGNESFTISEMEVFGFEK